MKMVASSTTTTATATATAASQLVGFSAAKRSFPSPALRPRSWIVAARLEGSSKSVWKLSGLRCASNPRRIRVERTGNSYASMEADEDEGKETNSAPISAATEQKRSAKIHDFCFGIPFGGVVLSGGIIGFLFSRNPATLGTGMLYGGALLALSTFSLKIWRQGKSCLPYILGQGALAAALLWKNFQAFSSKVSKCTINSLGKNKRYLSSLAEVHEFNHDGVEDDSKAAEKDTALHLALSELAGESNSEPSLSLKRFFRARHVPVISTGSLKLDLALGIGGLPKGRFVEIYGQEASGKTTLALHVIKEAQKLGGFCAYFDAENAMDPALAKSMGIDTENLLISRPDSAENLLSAVDILTKSGSVDVIVVDSVAALVPQYEVDVSIGDVRKDLQSRIMTQSLRRIYYSLCNSQTIIVFVNQIRSKSKQGSWHTVEETCGGNALKFYAAVRLRIRRTGLLKTENEVTGLGISVQVMKNKLAPAMKKADLQLHFGRGFCSVSEVLDLGCEYGVIMNEGSRYHIDGKFFSDSLEAKRYLAENKEVFDNMVSMLRRLMFKRGESEENS